MSYIENKIAEAEAYKFMKSNELRVKIDNMAEEIEKRIKKDLGLKSYENIPYPCHVGKLYSNNVTHSKADREDLQGLMSEYNSYSNDKGNLERIEEMGMKSVEEGDKHINEKKQDTLSQLQRKLSALSKTNSDNVELSAYYNGISTLLLSARVTKDKSKKRRIIAIIKSLISRMS